MFNWHKKESPILSVLGAGGGIGGSLTRRGGPTGPYSVEVKLWGAGGGAGSRPGVPGRTGGGGAFVKASFTAASGTVLYAYAGRSVPYGSPSVDIGLGGGGGAGGASPQRGAPGGGFSFFTVSTPHPRALGGSAPHNPFIIGLAAGGGGSSGGSGTGGGGASIGGNGGTGAGPGAYGRGATPTSGGASGPTGRYPGGFMYGGAGQDGNDGPGSPGPQGGGGGGSGWYGGGGGSYHQCCLAESGGGGGGVSYGLPSHPAIESPITFSSESGGNGVANTDTPAGGETDPQWSPTAKYGRGKTGNNGEYGYEGRVIINYGPPTNVTENTFSFGYSASDQSVTLP